jgi:hypothetical protein
MTTQRDSLLQEIQNIRSELERLLDGIDPYFDRQIEGEDWTIRELVYHLVDTPGSGGWGTIVPAVLEGRMQEIPIALGQTYPNPERQEKDVTGVGQDFYSVLTTLESSLANMTDSTLAERRVVYRSLANSTTTERNAQEMISNIGVHWREHLDRLAALRKTLGLDE